MQSAKQAVHRVWVDCARGFYALSFVTQAEVTAFQDECTRDLAVAEPVILEAEAALNSLDKASLGELKSFGSPAADVVAVVSACMILTAPGGKIPKVRTPKDLHGHFTQSCANIVHNMHISSHSYCHLSALFHVLCCLCCWVGKAKFYFFWDKSCIDGHEHSIGIASGCCFWGHSIKYCDCIPTTA